MLDDLPAAAGPAHLRPDAAADGRQRALPAVRRLRQELLRLQPARRLPGRPQRRRRATGAATGATSSARSRAWSLALLRGPDGSNLEILGGMALYVAISIAGFATLNAFLKTQHAHDHALFGAIAFTHLLLEVARKVIGGPSALTGSPSRRRDRARRHLVRAHDPQGEAVPGARGRRRPRRPRGRDDRPRAPRSPAPAASARSPAAPRRSPSCPTTSASRPSPGMSAARDRRGQRDADRGRLPDGHLRRRPGRDQGRHGAARRRSPTTSRPRSSASATPRTPAWRAACASPARSSVALTPDKAERAAHQPRSSTSTTTRTSSAIVVIGNGIAGVTAADHLRRRHPGVEDRPDRRGAPPPLQPHGHLAASSTAARAMQGLYLNPDAWYDERAITTWLNTRALWIDRDQPRGRARHGGEARLRPPDPRHRLAQLRPADRGLRRARHRRAAHGRRRDRACAPTRSRSATRRGVVAGGGLLGLEAAYALHKLGLKTIVLERSDRPARRQLDARARRAPAHLPRRPRAGDRASRPRSSRSTPTAACAASTSADGRQHRRRRSCSSRRASGPTSTSPATRGCASTAACSSTTACAPTTRTIFAAGDVAEYERRAARPVADRGRPGRGRGRERRGRREALPGHRAGDDPQGRRHRADLASAASSDRARRRGDRARGRRRPHTASS